MFASPPQSDRLTAGLFLRENVLLPGRFWWNRRSNQLQIFTPNLHKNTFSQEKLCYLQDLVLQNRQLRVVSGHKVVLGFGKKFGRNFDVRVKTVRESEENQEEADGRGGRR